MSQLVVTYLASPRASRNMDWTRLDCLYASLVLLRKYAPPLPVIVFHEDYQQTDMDRLRAVHPTIQFEQVDFSTHKDMFFSLRPAERVGGYGYAMMCRFFSGVVQAHPALQPYTHYMRLDDDSYLMSPLNENIISSILASDYTYRSTFQDYYQTLWDYTAAFVAAEKLTVNAGYVGEAPYNNFHAASLALWRHPVIARYVSGIENQHGCLQKGWDDAAIQGMIIFILCPALGLRVHLETGFDYRHNQQCTHWGPGHGKHCTDGKKGMYSWGPPECLD